MSAPPPIILSYHDLERLEQLVDSLSPANSKLDALRGELERATVVASDAIPPDVITMNSTARFVDEISGKEFELTLTFPDDKHLTHGTVSILAPIGSALLGLSAGQSIEWPLPSGRKTRLRVLEVTYQPEATRKRHVK